MGLSKAFRLAKKNNIKLVPVNKDGTCKDPRDIEGWQKTNRKIVLERVKKEIVPGAEIYDITEYKFAQHLIKSFEVHDYRAGSSIKPQIRLTRQENFRDAESIYSLMKAHDALTLLGGEPGPLALCLGIDERNQQLPPEKAREAQTKHYKKWIEDSSASVGFKLKNQQPGG